MKKEEENKEKPIVNLFEDVGKVHDEEALKKSYEKIDKPENKCPDCGLPKEND